MQLTPESVANNFYLNKAQGLVRQDGSPNTQFARWLELVSNAVQALNVFIGNDGNANLTADQIVEGLEDKVREITRNEFGDIVKVERKDPVTNEVVSTREITRTGGEISEVRTTTQTRVATYQIERTGGFISVITPEITDIGSA